jgi:outer membrane protein OmpA-like peptidoglycan-associated protein
MLEELLEAMLTYPTLVIQVEGHICCNPTPADGLDNETGRYNLSEARAKAVKDYLLEKGIHTDRVKYKGFGHTAPLYPYPEKSLEEEKLNRRVEIKILKK